MKLKILGYFGLLTFVVLAFASLLLAAELKFLIRYLSYKPTPSVQTKLEERPKCKGCNLILVSLDTLRADRLGFLGSNLGLTPNLDKIAAKSVNFRHAFTNAFFTTPSHMTIFTSLYPSTHRVETTDVKVSRLPKTTGPAIPLSQKFETLAEILKKSKYQTVWSAPINFKFLHFTEGFGRGFDKVIHPMFTRGLHFPLDAPLELKKSIFDQATSARKPFFLFAHSYITHLPYVRSDKEAGDAEIPYTPPRLLEGVERILNRVPETVFLDFEKPGFNLDRAKAACLNFKSMAPCFDRYVSEDGLVHRLGSFQLRTAMDLFADAPNPAELNGYVHAYDEGVRELDRQVGVFWENLEKAKLLENSVVIFLSDHGEELFDHGEGSHSTFFEHTARVPLLIYYPSLEAGEVRDDLVSLVDVMPTALNLLNVHTPDQAQGISVFGRPKDAGRVFGFSLGISYVRDLEWKYIQGEQGKNELYFLPLDPLEKNNLVRLKLPIVSSKIAEFESALSDWKIEQSL